MLLNVHIHAVPIALGSPISTDRMGTLCVLGILLFMFVLFGFCSNEGESRGPGEAPNTAVSVSLQGDRTTGDWQDSISPGLSGTQFSGIAPSV